MVEYNNLLIRHMKPGTTNTLPDYLKEQFLDCSSVIITPSPIERSIVTANNIARDLEGKINKVIVTNFDERITIPNFPENCNPKEIGEIGAYKRMLTEDHPEIYNVAQRFAGYILSAIGGDKKTVRLGISHSPAIDFLLYTLGIKNENSSLFGYLEGISFTGEKQGIQIKIIGEEKEHLIPIERLEKMAGEKK